MGVASAVLLTAPPPRRRVLATADLSSRGITSFVGRAWPVSMAVLVHAIVAISLAAGFASSRDEVGRVWVGTPFAAIGPELTWTAQAALIAGLTLWMLVALSALPTRVRQHAGLAAA